MISNDFAIEKVRSLKTFDIGSDGKVEVWNEDGALGLAVFRHTKQSTGLFGWCDLTSWELSIAVAKVFDDDRHRALENIMSWLDYRDPITEPDLMKSANFVKWSLNCLVDMCDSIANDSLSWKNNKLAVDVVVHPLNKNRTAPWSEMVMDRIGTGDTWSCDVDSDMFIIRYRYKNKARVS